MKRRFLLALLLAGCALAGAQLDPGGKWIGKLIKGPDVQSNGHPTELRTESAVYQKSFGSVTYSLDLKADHTFSRALRRGKHTSVSTGTWSVAGLAVTLVTNTISGAKIKPTPSLFVLSSDGKTLTYRQPNGVTLQYKRPK